MVINNMYESIDINDIDNITIQDNLIDIRDSYEFVISSIKGSINIPYNLLLMNPSDYLDNDKKYFIYCKTANKSRRLCMSLVEDGYNVVDLIGGYNKYTEKNKVEF